MDRMEANIGLLGADYFGRLKDRLDNEQDVVKKLIRLRGVLESAQSHISRLVQARTRYLRARNHRDRSAAQYEMESMTILLYEIADTVYMVINLLDINELNLSASVDGQGIVGEHATKVVRLVDLAESYCKQLLQFEREFGLRFDFQNPLDEREGVTFSKHVHWQDFVRGSVEDSFNAYFSRAQRALRQRMAAPIDFLHGRTIAEQLRRKGRLALLETVRRLEEAPLGSLHIERVSNAREDVRHEQEPPTHQGFSWWHLSH